MSSFMAVWSCPPLHPDARAPIAGERSRTPLRSIPSPGGLTSRCSEMELEHCDSPVQHPCMPSLVARLGGDGPCRVPRRPGSPAGCCYWNVADHVAANGGSRVFGWMLIEVPEVFLFAWHHAVWRSSDGELLDISGHPITGQANGTTTFVADPCQDYDLSWPPAMPQVYEPSIAHPTIAEFIRAYLHLHELQRAKQEALKLVPGAYYSPDDGQTRVDNPSGAVAFDQLNRRFDPAIARLDLTRAALVPQLIAVQSERLKASSADAYSPG